ncbi:MAG: Type 1 glutamine amidotransferase-like domain-containing protein [Chloroflexi bacterium]|nr:Type 1 glutamine amidotransferase-like domain-containing protein [Chloroflexota bacterium]
MNKIKAIYLLAGGRGGNSNSTDNILQVIFRDINKVVPTIAYVGVASDDNLLFYQSISSMIKNAGNCNITRIVLSSKKADIHKAQDMLNSADAVFMSGGDVEKGMQLLIEKNMVEFLNGIYNQGKLFFGASAGSIMLAREWVRWKNPDDDSTAELFPCLGFAPIICDTHAEGDNWAELQAALKLEAKNTMGYGIASGTCLKVSPNGEQEAIGGSVARYKKQDGKVTKQADLSPIQTVEK